ncbi:hypothetical protein [Streptomyces sp. NPDC060022]|uniref:hypothetical protein n=1 Tax=Streptomyces sp. NPDC060022 TaxID=3347039 RepID=UPI0036943493
MSKQEWDTLTKSEEAFMVNSYEIDIMAGVWGDLDEADQSRPVNELAGILLALIDRGWIDPRSSAHEEISKAEAAIARLHRPPVLLDRLPRDNWAIPSGI